MYSVSPFSVLASSSSSSSKSLKYNSAAVAVVVVLWFVLLRLQLSNGDHLDFLSSFSNHHHQNR